MKWSALVPCVVLAGACHYDWGVGPRDGADSGAGDATAADGGPLDAAVADAPIAEATPGQCALYADNIHILRPGLLPCTSVCTQSVYDECGCEDPVVDANGDPAKKFTAAVQTFKNAGCTPDCTGGCQAPVHACFMGDGGGFCF
jgi:hypothetical protein